MAQTQNNIAISDRDRKVIHIVTRLTDKELFGLECFLAGTRAGARGAGEKTEKQEQPEEMRA